MVVKEEKLAAAMLIINFANDIENLTNTYASYLNVLIRIKEKYGVELKGIDTEDQQALIQTSELLRSYIVRCWADSEKLQTKIPTIKSKMTEIRKLYKETKTASMIEIETAEKFITLLGTAFTEGVLEDLLVHSRDIYKEVLE